VPAPRASTPALADPLLTPLPVRAAPASPVVSTSPVPTTVSRGPVTAFVPGVVRRFIHLAASPISRRARQLAVSLLVGLAIWAWQLRTGEAFGLGEPVVATVPADGEARRGLRRFATGERIGKPPSLR
jgi:hypothetical protein